MENLQIEKIIEYAKEYRKIAPESIEFNGTRYSIDRSEFLKQRHVDADLSDFLNFIIEKETKFPGHIFSQDLIDK
jgi:hypothetical protein